MFDSLSNRLDDIFTRLKSRGRLSEKQSRALQGLAEELEVPLLGAVINRGSRRSKRGRRAPTP